MENIALLTCESELESAKKLGFTTYSNLGSQRVEDFDNTILINWGVSTPWYNRKSKQAYFKNYLNYYKNVASNVNKPLSLQKIGKVVRTPKLWVAGEKVPKGRLVVYRPVAHASGSNFQVKSGPFTVSPGYYAKAFIKSNKEYRMIYCCNNGGQFLMWKRVTDDKKLLKEKYKCRSEYGYEYIERMPKQLKEDTKKAFKAIGLLFGAADIIFYKGKYYFLELNSAATVSDCYVSKFFKENLIKLCKQKFKKFNPEQYKQMAKLPNCVKANLFE